MPFFRAAEGYILSTALRLDQPVPSSWRHRLQDIVGIMIKLADDNVGSVSGRRVPAPAPRIASRRRSGGGRHRDPGGVRRRPERGVPRNGARVTPAACCHSPRRPRPRCTTTGCPRTCSLPTPPSSPRSLGNPPILTIIAMAKRIAATCAGQVAPLRINDLQTVRAASPTTRSQPRSRRGRASKYVEVAGVTLEPHHEPGPGSSAQRTRMRSRIRDSSEVSPVEHRDPPAHLRAVLALETHRLEGGRKAGPRVEPDRSDLAPRLEQDVQPRGVSRLRAPKVARRPRPARGKHERLALHRTMAPWSTRGPVSAV